MNRRDLVKSTLLAAGALSVGGAIAPEVLAQADGMQTDAVQAMIDAAQAKVVPHRLDNAPMPNVLWICPDQMRGDCIAALGNPNIRTPHLDKLVSESTVFTEAYCQTGICCPSRGSFMTGRYPRETNLKSNSEYIRPTEKLVSRWLKDFGYHCGLAGKLHLSPCDHNFVESRIDDGYDDFWWSHDLQDAWNGKNMWRQWLARNNQQWPAAPKNARATEVWGVPIDPKWTQTAYCSQMAIDFMRSRKKVNASQPWMMSVHMFQPHSPYYPTAEYLSRYDPAKMPAPAYVPGELEDKPSYQATDHEGAYGGHGKSFANESDLQHRQTTAAYYAMIEQVDTEVGRMLAALDELGERENTLVIFHSDHGSMLGDHGIYEKGPYFYDSLMRVPLLMRLPGRIQAGVRSSALVEQVDIAPTVLEAASLTVPAGIQGKSLMPVLTGVAAQHRTSAYMEYFNAVAKYTPPPMATGVRSDRYKLTYWHSLGTGELYDMTSDSGEVHNLWGSASAKDAQNQMMQLLSARMIGSVDPLGPHVF